MKTNIINRPGKLSKTGQTVSYATNDDGDLEMGWEPRESQYFNIDNSGDLLVCDMATGLMWPRDCDENGWNNKTKKTWAAALTWAASLDFGGYTDWRIPNIIELLSMFNNKDTSPPHVQNMVPVWMLNNVENWSAGYMWGSGSYQALTTYAQVFSIDGVCTRKIKTASYHVVAVRNF